MPMPSVLVRPPQAFVGRAPHADDELGAHAGAYGSEHFACEAQPVAHVAAIGRVQFIREWRPELVHQMSVGLQFNAIYACCFHALGCIGIVLDDAVNIPRFHLLGE